MKTPRPINLTNWGTIALLIFLSGCAQNADFMNGSFSQDMLPMPANASLPHYPPLEILRLGGAVDSADSDPKNESASADLTDQLAMLGIAPNPFNPIVQLDFTVPVGSRAVSLTIHGVDGRLVSRLIKSELGEGTHTVTWRGRDDEGRRLPSGVYIARLHAGGEVTMRKMLLVQ